MKAIAEKQSVDGKDETIASTTLSTTKEKES